MQSDEARRVRAAFVNVPHYRRYCGWCGGVWLVSTNGKDLRCAGCGK
jgi:hypothetical protein